MDLERGKNEAEAACLKWADFGGRTQQGVQTPYKKKHLYVLGTFFLEHLGGFGKNKVIFIKLTVVLERLLSVS